MRSTTSAATTIAFTPRSGRLACQPMPCTTTSHATIPLWARKTAVEVGSPTHARRGAGTSASRAGSSPTSARAPREPTSSAAVNAKTTGRASRPTSSDAAMITHCATKPFMSDAPRPYARSSSTSKTSASRVHPGCPSNGTTSTCPETTRPSGSGGPAVASRLTPSMPSQAKRCRLTRIPGRSRQLARYAIASALLRVLTVSKAISRRATSCRRRLVLPSAERVIPGDVLADDQAVHILGPLVGVHRLQVQHVADDGILVDDAVGAEDVARLACDVERGADVVHLRHADLLGTHGALLLQPPEAETEQLPLRDL